MDSAKPAGSAGKNASVTEEEKQRLNCKAVAFDLFGTLVRRTYTSTCYRDLFWMIEIDPEDGRRLAMTKNLGLSRLAEELVPDHGLYLDDLEEALRKDLSGIILYDDTIETLASLHDSGIPIALISNLAQPYAEYTLRLLETTLGCKFNTVAFSCELGMLKPQPNIFLAAYERLKIVSENIVMVGKNYRDDIAGAEAVGMASLLLDRNGWYVQEERTIKTLLQVVQSIDGR
jgi:HAD superfamily hydrolase (TIGR01549 family)